MIKKGMFGALLATATLLIFSGAAQAQYGGPGDTITVVQGESLAVSGDGCAPGATVTFTLTSGEYSAEIGTATADADGAYDSTVVIPSNAPAGAATLSNSCDTSVLGLQINAAPAVTPGTLPRTGSNTQTLVGVGAGFLLLGGTLAIGARRTRRTAVA
ncbi:MAG: hypothetical protein JWM47_3251 [Acidimicrobiales bacterium]|nr:hypothetical protein [Acidimicrobiales bacterium]